MSKLYKYDIDITHIIEAGCFTTFLNSLKLHIPSFVTYTGNQSWFSLMNQEEEYQAFVDNFDCTEAEAELRKKFPKEPTMVIMQDDPKTNSNIIEEGLMWINEVTGRMFTCTSAKTDNNIWVSTDNSEIIRPVPIADTFDILGDGSTIALYQLNSDTLDVGGKYHGSASEIIWKEGLEGEAASSEHSGQIRIKKLPFNKNTEAVTIGAWLNWNGSSGCMPFGFKEHDLYCYGGNIGFNTANGDLDGVNFKNYKNKWVYLMCTFKKNEYGNLYLDGINQTPLTQRGSINTKKAIMNSTFNLFGWSRDLGYRNFGLIERVRIINREITDEEALMISEAEIEFIASINGGKQWS